MAPGGWSHGDLREVVNDAFFILLPTLAAVAAGLAARSQLGRQRRAWTALAVGLAGWAVGSAFWALYELVLDRYPIPSPADAGYLIFPLGAGVALLLFPAGGYAKGRAFLDGVIVAASAFFISWVTVLDEVFRTSQQSRFAMVVGLAYPLLDVLLLTLAATVLANDQVHQRRAVTLLATGVACLAVADSVFCYQNAQGTYATGSPVDLGWAAGFLVITVAAAVARAGTDAPDTSTTPPGWVSVLLPYSPLLLAVMVAIAAPRTVLNSARCRPLGLSLCQRLPRAGP